MKNHSGSKPPVTIGSWSRSDPFSALASWQNQEPLRNQFILMSRASGPLRGPQRSCPGPVHPSPWNYTSAEIFDSNIVWSTFYSLKAVWSFIDSIKDSLSGKRIMKLCTHLFLHYSFGFFKRIKSYHPKLFNIHHEYDAIFWPYYELFFDLIKRFFICEL